MLKNYLVQIDDINFLSFRCCLFDRKDDIRFMDKSIIKKNIKLLSLFFSMPKKLNYFSNLDNVIQRNLVRKMRIIFGM